MTAVTLQKDTVAVLVGSAAATRSIDNSLGGSFLHWQHAPSGRTIGLHMRWRDQSHLVTQRHELAARMMPRTASLHRHHAGREPAEKL
jgi:hypothetical protein